MLGRRVAITGLTIYDGYPQHLAMCPGEALRVHLKGRKLVSGPPPRAEGPDILLPREQELQEADTAVLASLLHAQQYKLVRQPLLAQLAVVKLAKAGERLDRVLCGVVVPGDVVVVQEGKEPS